MVVQSPTSVKSQILTNDEANPTSGFVSQLPFLTQPSYKVPIRKENPSILNDGSKQLSNILDELRPTEAAQFSGTSQLDNQNDANRAASGRDEPNDMNEATVIVPNASLDKSRNILKTQNTIGLAIGQNLLSSSNESLDCRPLLLPQDSKQTTRILKPAGERLSLPRALCDNRPFLLYERIRSMRENSRKEGQRLSIKWTRSISRTQKGILDSEDAWNPPLSGRPHRPGTIPIDILNVLTLRADREAEEMEQQRENIRHNTIDSERATHVNTFGKTPSPASPPALADSVSDESDDSSETRAASEWASSPPRPKYPNLPPDTSPRRPGELGQMQSPLSLEDAALDKIEAHPQPETEDADSEDIQTRQVKPLYVAKLNLQDHPHAACPFGQGLAIENAKGKTRELSQQNGVFQHEEDATKSPEEQAETALRKVQVKHTPYPVKGDLSVRKQPNVTSGLPQSSFVPATFPDVAARRPVPQMYATPAIPNKSHPSSQSHIQQSQMPASIISDTMLTSVRISSVQPVGANQRSSDGKSPRDSVRNHPASSVASSSTTKRSRDRGHLHESRSVPYTDHAYEEHDRLRKRQRQEFRRTHSKHKTDVSIDRSFEAANQPMIDQYEHSLENHSKQFDNSEKPEDARLSIIGTEDDLSFHTSSTLNAVSKASDLIADSVARNGGALANLFTKFKLSYPQYCGSEKAFCSALDLLLKLKAASPYFHPFLWDDFIYRFAHDYKTYKRICLEEDENVVPYEVFYLSQVKRPECEKECVTAKSLHGALNHTDPNIRRQSRSSSDNTMEISRTEITSIGPEFMVTNMAECQRVIDTKAMQSPPPASIQETPVVQRYRSQQTKPLSAKKRGLPPSWPSNSGGQASNTINPFRGKTAQIAPEVQDPTSTPEPSSKVEDWRSSLRPVRPFGKQSPELLPEQPHIPIREESVELLPDKIVSDIEPRRDQFSDAAIETVPPRSGELDSTGLRLPRYLTPDNTVLRSIESSDPTNKRLLTSQNRISQHDVNLRKLIRQSNLPTTLFGAFERNYSNLAQERNSKKAWQKNKASGVNLYGW